MYIIVVGGGGVGYYLAKALLEEGHEILIIEQNPAICDVINDELGGICTRGDGCEVSTLMKAGATRAAMFVAVTGEDQHNLVACQN
jgi:trk system potassium uptake protein TrkA